MRVEDLSSSLLEALTFVAYFDFGAESIEAPPPPPPPPPP